MGEEWDKKVFAFAIWFLVNYSFLKLKVISHNFIGSTLE
jgi:hypothetical protein